MAKTLVTADGYGQLAIWYYNKFPIEPISETASLSAENPETIEQTSLSTLFDQLLKLKSGTDVIVVTHGSDYGMYMQLTPKNKNRANTSNLSNILSATTADLVKNLSFEKAEADDFLARAEAVRKLKLGHIAFRGCSIGSQKKNLEVLRDFLGAQDASAASVLSTYGAVTPQAEASAKFSKSWAAAVKDSKNHRFEGKSGRLIFWRGASKEEYKDLIKVTVDNKKVLHEWFQAAFLPNVTEAVSGSLHNATPLHYLAYNPPLLPYLPNPDQLAYTDFLARASD